MADELNPGGMPAPWLRHAASVPDSSEAEIEAFSRTCETLAGFDPAFGFDTADGFLTALAALPQVPPVDAWLPALCGDAFDRAFADPEAQAQARTALERRLAVLVAQLDPGAMLDDPEALRLAPLMPAYTDEDRQRLRAEGVAEDELPLFDTGVAWADGFFEAVGAFEALWTPPPGDEPRAAFDVAFAQIDALRLTPDEDAWTQHLATYWPKEPPTRDDLITEACYAVQDLRLFWVDFAPVTAPRKAEATPGRNDPCPCGSGKKFKKCHGAAA